MKDGWMGFQEAQRTSHWPHDNQADGMVARVHQALATARQMTPPNEDDGIIDDDGTGHSNHCLVSSTSITTVRVGRRLRDTGRVRT